jgi:ssDNA-binding Zn-finger/Zn-ribbon topoisomerase 1
MAKKHNVRIGTLDIETAPIVSYIWSLGKQNVGIHQILEDWSILSISYKWLDERNTVCHDVAGQADLRDDRKLLDILWAFMNEADIIVAQNGVGFDVKKINARFIEAGMPPPRPFKVVDTMLEARKIARFTSNKLEWLSAKLTNTPKSSHSAFPGMLLWVECLKDNPKAWATMRKYNPIDVVATEKLYLKLRPYIQGHPNVNAYDDDDETLRCPKCGSAHMRKDGFVVTQTGKYQQYQCAAKGCGGWARDRYTHNSKGKRKSLLSN